MIHLASRLHAFVYGLFQPSDAKAVRELYDEVEALLERNSVARPSDRRGLGLRLAADAFKLAGEDGEDDEFDRLNALASKLLDYEGLFVLPDVNWSDRRSVSDWWTLREELDAQRTLLRDFDGVCSEIISALAHCHAVIAHSLPAEKGCRPDAITVPVSKLRSTTTRRFACMCSSATGSFSKT